MSDLALDRLPEDLADDFAGTLSTGYPGEDDLQPGAFDCEVAGKKKGVHTSGNGQSRLLNSIDEGEDESGDDEVFIAAQQAASNRQQKSKSGKKGGGFQSMGLGGNIIQAVNRKGFSVPTPIQRKTIPVILDGQDVVGMARTGSGKTAAFVIPMIEKLKAHSAKVGARAIVLSPSRELALQTLRCVKDFGRGTDLRTVVLVGGDSLEDQFRQISCNPDIIIATPGRFMHLLVEMSLDLSSVRYAVFDEADRLFEMGFVTQLHEILHAIPPSRQTLLFSATLPKSLVEFARAGLKDPNLIRLDTETKISPDLKSSFFTVQGSNKEAALLHILGDIIRMPTSEQPMEDENENPKKRKRKPALYRALDSPTEHSTVIFAATKHHVEYLANLLVHAGYSVAYNYGSLDQIARKTQVERFCNGLCSILVVTDVAARGIDIPLLANVINYDFPSQPKIFIHRVGRTARAGRRGWSYNLLQPADVPYLLDLQLFLGRKLIKGKEGFRPASFSEDVVCGSIPPVKLESYLEWTSKMVEDVDDLKLQRSVASRGEKLYIRSRSAASNESVRNSRPMIADQSLQRCNALYDDESHEEKNERDSMLAKISGFRPSETVFEIGRRGNVSETGEVVKKQRTRVQAKRARDTRLSNQHNVRHTTKTQVDFEDAENGSRMPNVPDEDVDSPGVTEGQEEAHASDVESDARQKGLQGWQDEEHFMSYEPRDFDSVQDRGYGVRSGADNATRSTNFVGAARSVTMDLAQDEGGALAEAGRNRPMRWDKKSKKYVSRINDEDGSKGQKMIRSESGQKIAASFRSGRFDDWQRQNRMKRQKIGEQEDSRVAGRPQSKKFKHSKDKAPRQPDKYRDDFEKQKKKTSLAKSRNAPTPRSRNVKGGLKSEDDIRKNRQLQDRRRQKHARPSRKK